MQMFSKIEDFLESSEQYIDYVCDTLNSPSETPSNKERFFLDNRDNIQNCLTNLRSAKERLLDSTFAENSDEGRKVKRLISDIDDLIECLFDTIEAFKASMLNNIKNDSSIDDITPVIDENTVSDAMSNNKDIQQISKDMSDIAAGKVESTQPSTKTQPKYALVVKGKTTYIHANTKDELTKKMTNVLNSLGYNGPDVKLYEITYKELKLKTQVVYTI